MIGRVGERRATSVNPARTNAVFIPVQANAGEIFFLDLPKEEEREEIFKIHLQEFRPNSWESFDYSKLAQASESFSGAEIRQSIIEGMYHAFYEKREFTTDDICLSLKELIPLAHLESDQMIRLQNWASSGRIRLASSKHIYLN